ncbi:MAG: NAD(P)H-dependent oxidoreductase [Bacteroidia bacterium]|nr:NAD(P)H-dependent oxidoreductase [Bacteroidia bacterium]
MKVAIIVGSIRKERQSHKVGLYLKSVLEAMPAIECKYLDLLEYELPLLSEKWREQEPVDERLLSFSDALKSSDAIIFISPEYHGSYTGVLKNAVDHFWPEFYKKVIGVVVTGSGKFGGINASTQMQQLILSLGAYPMPQKLIIPYIQEAFADDGSLLKEDIRMQSMRFIEELSWLGNAIKAAKINTTQAN